MPKVPDLIGIDNVSVYRYINDDGGGEMGASLIGTRRGLR